MIKEPMKRQAGQSVEEMAFQLAESKKDNRLYDSPKHKGNYKEISEQVKAEQLARVIDQQMQFLIDAKERGKVNLDNVDEIRATAILYMQSCKESSTVPTVLGFATACGLSRNRIYEYIRNNDNESSEFLDLLRSSWGSVIAQSGLNRSTSEAVSIFLLKNSGQGLQDRTELEISAKPFDPLGKEADTDELRQKYLKDTYGTQEP